MILDELFLANVFIHDPVRDLFINFPVKNTRRALDIHLDHRLSGTQAHTSAFFHRYIHVARLNFFYKNFEHLFGARRYPAGAVSDTDPVAARPGLGFLSHFIQFIPRHNHNSNLPVTIN
jgi:hypothetical protein